jgi:tRNA modification GTPase
MKPRKVYHGYVVDPKQNQKVDEVICFYFKAPYSYTGEDVVEIQTHGGILGLQKVIQLLYEQGVSSAEAGEFTKRAFLNGRLDLTQAEAVMDLIQADSSAELRKQWSN